MPSRLPPRAQAKNVATRVCTAPAGVSSESNDDEITLSDTGHGTITTGGFTSLTLTDHATGVKTTIFSGGQPSSVKRSQK